MVNSIIFSKDNAISLSLFLDSLDKYAKDIFNLNVIYSYSNEEFKKGYEKLKSENKYNIKWIEQSILKENVLQVLQSNSNHTCFFVDNDIFYKKFDITQIEKSLYEDQNLFSFSLRLGTNTKYCYLIKSTNTLCTKEEKDGIIKWDWTKHFFDYSFPISMHGHVFRTKDVLRLVKQVGFKSYEELEEALQIFDTFPKTDMASFSDSVLIDNTFKTNLKQENEKFLSGELYSLEKMDIASIVINGCSQPVEPKLKSLQNA